MDEIIAAIFASQMQPKQVEVDEMGMGGGGDSISSLAQMLMNGSTDVSMTVPQKFKVGNSFGEKAKNNTTTLAPSYGQW